MTTDYTLCIEYEDRGPEKRPAMLTPPAVAILRYYTKQTNHMHEDYTGLILAIQDFNKETYDYGHSFTIAATHCKSRMPCFAWAPTRSS